MRNEGQVLQQEQGQEFAADVQSRDWHSTLAIQRWTFLPGCWPCASHCLPELHFSVLKNRPQLCLSSLPLANVHAP